MNRRQALAALSTGLLLYLVGCGSNEPSSAAPGDETSVVTLRIATYDNEAVLGGILVNHFAQAVHDLEPTITVESSYEAAPDEQATIKLIQAGNFDLGLVATRAWDLENVDTLRAINTPFLIDSTELLDQVVASDQAAIMMNGLSKADMTGLAILPEALRHPFGTEASPLGLEDYQGATIRSPHSNTTWDLFSALGATPMFEENGYTIAESQFEQAPAPEGTGNVTFYAKADVIVVSDAAKTKVSASQLDALTEAAKATRDWAIGTFDDDAAAAGKYCKNGGKIAAATPADVEALKNAAAPVIADLKGDATTAAIIAAIQELKTVTTAPTAVTACSTQSKASLLNGTYRWDVTKEALIEAGVSDPTALNDVPSINRATLEDGTFNLTYQQTEGPNKGDTHELHQTYEFDGETFIIHWSQEPTNCTKVKAKILQDGSLEFSNVVECAADQASLVLDQAGLRVWKKIK